jgi:glycosyltransferase involved in cell wall biosynthesis
MDARPRKQAELLASNGFRVDIICRGQTQNEAKVERFGNVTAYRVLKNSNNEKAHSYVLDSLSFFLVAFLKLQILHIKKRYDLIQIHNMPNFHVFTAIIQKLFGASIVLDLHDLTVELLEAKWPGNKYAFLKAADKFLEKISCKFADALITVSEGCKARLVERGNPSSKITLVLNSANQNIFKFDKKRQFEEVNENAILLYHGTIAEHFGLHIAIEAMSEVVKKIPNSKFYIYGKYYPTYKNRLEDKIRDLNLEESVFLFGIITLEECYLKIREADIGIVPYVNNDYENIGLSNKTFEYTASGLPVVASRLFSLKSIFDEDCIQYAEPENPADFADKIIKLCKDPQLRKEKTLNACNALSKISGEVMDRRYINLIISQIQRKNNT